MNARCDASSSTDFARRLSEYEEARAAGLPEQLSVTAGSPSQNERLRQAGALFCPRIAMTFYQIFQNLVVRFDSSGKY